MRSTWKRTLSAILTVCMIASLLVVPAAAAPADGKYIFAPTNLTTGTQAIGTNVTTGTEDYFTIRYGDSGNDQITSNTTKFSDDFTAKQAFRPNGASKGKVGRVITFTPTTDNPDVKIWWTGVSGNGGGSPAIWKSAGTSTDSDTTRIRASGDPLWTDTDKSTATEGHITEIDGATLGLKAGTEYALGCANVKLDICRIEVVEAAADPTVTPAPKFTEKVVKLAANKATFTLTAAPDAETVYNLYASDASSDTTVVATATTTTATVEFTGVDAGTYYVAAKKGELTESSRVALTIRAADSVNTVTLSKNSVTLDVGGTETLTATTEPAETTETITWTSDNKAAATVRAGVITAVKPGVATITATANDFASAKATVVVNGTTTVSGPAYTFNADQMAPAAGSATVKYDSYYTLLVSADTYLATGRKEWTGNNKLTTANYLRVTKKPTASSGLKFTTSGPATVKIWWVAGGANDRQIAIYDTKDLSAAAAVTMERDVAHNAAYVSTVSLKAAGTYVLGADRDNSGTSYVGQVIVTEPPAATAAKTAVRTLVESLSAKDADTILFSTDLGSGDTTTEEGRKAIVKSALDAKLSAANVTGVSVAVNTATLKSAESGGEQASLASTTSTQTVGVITYTATLTATSDSSTANIGGEVTVTKQVSAYAVNASGLKNLAISSTAAVPEGEDLVVTISVSAGDEEANKYYILPETVSVTVGEGSAQDVTLTDIVTANKSDREVADSGKLTMTGVNGDVVITGAAVLDTKALDDVIETAQKAVDDADTVESVSGVDVPANKHWVTSAQKAELAGAVTTAKSAKQTGFASHTEMIAARTALNTARTKYNTAWAAQTGTKIVVSGVTITLPTNLPTNLDRKVGQVLTLKATVALDETSYVPQGGAKATFTVTAGDDLATLGTKTEEGVEVQTLTLNKAGSVTLKATADDDATQFATVTVTVTKNDVTGGLTAHFLQTYEVPAKGREVTVVVSGVPSDSTVQPTLVCNESDHQSVVDAATVTEQDNGDYHFTFTIAASTDKTQEFTHGYTAQWAGDDKYNAASSAKLTLKQLAEGALMSKPATLSHWDDIPYEDYGIDVAMKDVTEGGATTVRSGVITLDEAAIQKAWADETKKAAMQAMRGNTNGATSYDDDPHNYLCVGIFVELPEEVTTGEGALSLTNQTGWTIQDGTGTPFTPDTAKNLAEQNGKLYYTRWQAVAKINETSGALELMADRIWRGEEGMFTFAKDGTDVAKLSADFRRVTVPAYDLTAAKGVIEGATYTAVAQADADTETKAVAEAQKQVNAILAADPVALAGVTAQVKAQTSGFTAAEDGTDGSLKFTVTLHHDKALADVTTDELTLVITATPVAATKPKAHTFGEVAGLADVIGEAATLTTGDSATLFVTAAGSDVLGTEAAPGGYYIKGILTTRAVKLTKADRSMTLTAPEAGGKFTLYINNNAGAANGDPKACVLNVTTGTDNTALTDLNVAPGVGVYSFDAATATTYTLKGNRATGAFPFVYAVVWTPAGYATHDHTDDTKLTEIPALATEATCEVKATKTYYCTADPICFETVTKEIGELADHDYVNGFCKWCGTAQSGGGALTGITVEPESVTVEANHSVTVNVGKTPANADNTVVIKTQPAAGTATATLESGVLTIKGVAPGTTTVVLSGTTATTVEKVVNITVTAQTTFSFDAKTDLADLANGTDLDGKTFANGMITAKSNLVATDAGIIERGSATYAKLSQKKRSALEVTIPAGATATVTIVGSAGSDGKSLDLGLFTTAWAAQTEKNGATQVSGTAQTTLIYEDVQPGTYYIGATGSSTSGRVYSVDIKLAGNVPTTKYTITYELTADEGTITATAPAAQTVDAGTTVTLPTAPTVAGYTFDGWYVNDVKVTGATIVADANKTVTGKYTKDGENPPITVNKTALNAAITDAEGVDVTGVAVSAEDGADVPTSEKWIAKSVKDDFDAKLAAAKDMAEKTDATQAEVDAAKEALATATAALTDAITNAVNGTKVVTKDDLTAAIEAAQTAHDAIAEGTDPSAVTKDKEFVTPQVKADYQTAIDAAKAVAEDPDADGDAVAQALADLNTATRIFEAAKQVGTKTGGNNQGYFRPSTPDTSTTTTKNETLADGTKRTTETKADGTVTVTDTLTDGTKAVTTTTPAGEVTTTVTLGRDTESVQVSVPVADATTGMVPVIVKADGTEEIIRDSAVVDDTVIFDLDENATVKIVNNAKSFVDVPGHWAESDVNFVAARELFNGVDATHFAPDATMTRGMMATVLFRLDGETKGEKSVDFSDVTAGDWFAEAVDWAAEQGVINGYTDGSFGPNRSITREELVVMVYRYAGAPEVDAAMGMAGFNDVDQISTWAETAMRWAVQNGIINGKGNGTLDPQGNASRAEVSAVLQRYVKLAK